MERLTLSPDKVLPGATAKVAKFHRSYVEEVKTAVEANEWVIVGMAQNPVVKRARKLLDDAGFRYTYIGHGSYLSKWRERLAIKLWAGFPTFPMVFRNGTLIGGASELAPYLAEKGARAGGGEQKKSEGSDQSSVTA